ncbi:hypothetical protein FRC10_009650, partial [Ceratobasidium sp. 414]
MDKELAERRALVIGIQYFPPRALWSTLSDAYNIADMLGILPVNYGVIVRRDMKTKPGMNQMVETETVLFDWELISCLVDSLPDVKLRLT